MNVDLGALVSGPVAGEMPRPGAMAVAGKAEKAARDFEAVLVTSLFASLEKSFAWDQEDSTPGASDYRMMATRALAGAVAAGGGIGIAKFIVSHLPQSPSPVTKVPGGS